MSAMPHTPLKPTLRRLLIGCAVLLVPLAGAANAHAYACKDPALGQPFLSWEDPAAYFLVDDGDFSGGGAGWELAGAEVVAENQPWNVHGSTAPAALALADGASAVSPPVCVDPDRPTMRFFARSVGGTLTVDVLYHDADGLPASVTIGTLSADTAAKWTPSPALPITANVREMDVSFRFTASGGAWLVDDVYVDPYRKG